MILSSVCTTGTTVTKTTIAFPTIDHHHHSHCFFDQKLDMDSMAWYTTTLLSELRKQIQWINHGVILELLSDRLFLEQCTAVETVISDSDVLSTINGIKTNILHSIDHHEGTPFSIQRLCELIRSPTRHYRLFIKYLYAIEKVLSVASTWESFYGETLTESTESHQNITDFITNYETPQVTMSPIQCNRFDTDDDDDDGDDIDKNNNDDDEEEVNDDSNNNNDDDNEGEVNDDDSNNNNDDDEKEVANDDEEQSEQHNDDTGIDTTSGPSNDIQQDSLHGSGQVDHNKEDNNNDVARIDDQDTTHINGSSDDSSDDINGAGENDNDKKDDGGGLVDSSLHTDNEPTTTQDEKQQAKRPIKTDTGSNNKRKRGPSNQDKNKIRKTTDDSNLP
ncbi:hypothetical protein BC941DRAFT_423454 [Chlamydoabsidia padenii]|nr:hypothetical protein BC941DRAFT_423454 [Chlamydoabsidia padenii]